MFHPISIRIACVVETIHAMGYRSHSGEASCFAILYDYCPPSSLSFKQTDSEAVKMLHVVLSAVIVLWAALPVKIVAYGISAGPSVPSTSTHKHQRIGPWDVTVVSCTEPAPGPGPTPTEQDTNTYSSTGLLRLNTGTCPHVNR